MQTRIYFLLLMCLLASCAEDTSTLSSNKVKRETKSAFAAASTLTFAGYTWNVRENTAPQGPGPNYFSSANAWVDTKGRLHLKLALNPANGRWECAEVILNEKLGYGTYQWKINAALHKLDKNIVLGLFNYSGNNRYDEMDIEFSKWGYPDNLKMLNYTVWPETGSTLPYVEVVNPLPQSKTTTHRFTRTSNSITFKSMNCFQDDDTKLFATKTWTNPPTSISTLAMPVFMNLWCFRGAAPSDGKNVEIIIHDFKYTPL